uniref:Uncharacterized protein n=1 Tax=viral metagenome TaxID=1070528 RepID=A0A6C0CMK0_9ZZZZ
MTHYNDTPTEDLKGLIKTIQSGLPEHDENSANVAKKLIAEIQSVIDSRTSNDNIRQIAKKYIDTWFQNAKTQRNYKFQQRLHNNCINRCDVQLAKEIFNEEGFELHSKYVYGRECPGKVERGECRCIPHDECYFRPTADYFWITMNKTPKNLERLEKVFQDMYNKFIEN